MLKPRMHLELPVKNQTVIALSLGWFSGEPFMLFHLSLMEKWAGLHGLTIIGLTIAKFTFQVSACQ